MYISDQDEEKAKQTRAERDAKRGSKFYEGKESDLPATVTKEDGSLDKLKKAEAIADFTGPGAEAPTEAPAEETSGDSQVMTDPNDSRYQYQVLSDGNIKIVAAPEDTGFTGMILDDKNSEAYKAIMGVFSQTGTAPAGGGEVPEAPTESMGTSPMRGAPMPETPHLGQDPVLPEFEAPEALESPPEDVPYSARAVADRVWDQFYPPQSDVDLGGEPEVAAEPAPEPAPEPYRAPPIEFLDKEGQHPRVQRMIETMSRANQIQGGDQRERMKAAGASLQEAIEDLKQWWNAEPEPDKNYAPGSGGYRAHTYPKQ